MCDRLTIKLNTISKCFTISNKIRLYRVIFTKNIKKFEYKEHKELKRFLSTSLDLGLMLIRYGLNSYYYYIESEYDKDSKKELKGSIIFKFDEMISNLTSNILSKPEVIIEIIDLQKGINIIPISLASTEDEKEILLVPSTKLKLQGNLNASFTKIDLKRSVSREKGYIEPNIQNHLILWHKLIDNLNFEIKYYLSE